MTDATAGRGGVGIRLYTSGGELVRRTFDQVSDSGKKMWAEISLGQKAANPAFRALSSGVNEVKGGMDGLASRAGVAGNALGAFGFAGVAAAAALGAVAMAVTASFDAMHRAADLTDAADRIGITTTELQRWGYVADEAGVQTQSFQGNLEKLNGVLGAFKLGIGDAKLKPIFEELGITKEQLAGVQTADQLMLILADTLGQVQDRAKQVKFARALGVEESLPILRLGAAEIKNMGDAAEDLGLVLDQDMNKRLDEADRKMEIAGQQMRILRDTAVGPLGEAFADATGYLAGLAVEFSKIEAKAPQWLQVMNALGRAMPLSGTYQRAAEYVVGRINKGRTANAPDPLGGYDLSSLSSDLRGIAAGGGGGFDPKGHTGGGSSKASKAASEAAKAEREAEQRRQRGERVADQIDKLSDDVLKEMEGEYRTIAERHGFARDRLEDEARERDLAIQRGQEEFARTKGLRGISDVEAAILREKEGQLTAAKLENDRQKERREQAARRLEDDATAAQAAADMLGIEADLAKTAGERARIQREILIIEQKIARDRLEQQLRNDNELSDGQIAAQLGALDRRQAGERTVFDHDETERLRSEFKSYGREVVGAIQDGRIGEYIGDQLKAKLLDGALDALFNMMSGAGKSESGSSGFWNTALKFGASLFGGGKTGGGSGSGDLSKLFQSGGGKASGGGTRASFMYGTAEHGSELFMLSGNGHVSSAAETAKMVREMGGGGQGGGSAAFAAPAFNFPPVTINAPGADAAALRRVEEEVRNLNRTLEQRAIEAMADYRQRTHGRG